MRVRLFEHRLRDLRGGCRCGDPDASPPCSTCCDPVQAAEVTELVGQLTEAELLDQTWLPDRESGESYVVYQVLRAMCEWQGPGFVRRVWDGCDELAQLNMLNQMRGVASVLAAQAAGYGPEWGAW